MLCDFMFQFCAHVCTPKKRWTLRPLRLLKVYLFNKTSGQTYPQNLKKPDNQVIFQPGGISKLLKAQNIMSSDWLASYCSNQTRILTWGSMTPRQTAPTMMVFRSNQAPNPLRQPCVKILSSTNAFYKPKMSIRTPFVDKLLISRFQQTWPDLNWTHMYFRRRVFFSFLLLPLCLLCRIHTSHLSYHPAKREVKLRVSFCRWEQSNNGKIWENSLDWFGSKNEARHTFPHLDFLENSWNTYFPASLWNHCHCYWHRNTGTKTQKDAFGLFWLFVCWVQRPLVTHSNWIVRSSLF